jgi:phosphoglycerate kinase
MRAAIPTIQKILKDGGSIVFMSHLGRPKDGPTQKYSLVHLVNHLAEITHATVKFADDCIGENTNQLAQHLQAGEILLLENLRFYKEEEKGEVAFAKKLAALGDVYVNDAFGTAHRAHASTTIVAQFFPENKMFGYVMASELANAEKVLHAAVKPYTAIMGGAKVSDKILLIEKLIDRVDHLIIGGGMAYTFAKALGGNIGSSLVEEDKIPLALSLIQQAKDKGVNLCLPIDSIIADAFSNDANISTAMNNAIPDGWMGLDIGEKSIHVMEEILAQSKTILWNGPMGVFEMSNFEAGTKAVAIAVVKATQAGAFSLIGGGDSAAAVAKFNLSDQVSYVSTGGGALLEYMEGKVLPGVAAILS